MSLLWNREAVREARSIRRLVAIDHPRRALTWRRELVERVDILRTYPRAGRVVPEFGIENLRELVFGNYRIWYIVTPGKVEILRLWDARRDAPTEVRESPAEYRLL